MSNCLASLVPVSKEALTPMLTRYAQMVEAEYNKSKEEYLTELKEEMAKPRWFGLVTNPTDEEIREFTGDFHQFDIWGFTRTYQDRLHFYQCILKAIEHSIDGKVYMSLPDLNRLAI